MIHKILPLLLIATALTACKGGDGGHDDWSEARTRMEERGAKMLSQARNALHHRDYDAARRHIKTLREECELAFDAREAGILLLDSIDLCESVSELKAAQSRARQGGADADSLQAAVSEWTMKVKFYRRKLQHDRENSGTAAGTKQSTAAAASNEE